MAETYADQPLSSKFGPEVINYFSGFPLNRLSFLRDTPTFLSSALVSSHVILFNNLHPLTTTTPHYSVHFLPYTAISHLIPNPFTFESEDAYTAAYDSRDPIPPIFVFLGVDEKDLGSGFEYQGQGGKSGDTVYKGRPYFAVDVSGNEKARELALGDVKEGDKTEGPNWRPQRVDMGLPAREAAMVGFGRQVLHWNMNNRFCSSCGSSTISIHAGTKRVCPGTDKALIVKDGDTGNRVECTVRKGVHNIAFPRTDPTVIMAIVNSTGDKVLLGHNKRFPKGFFSTLAGFCEPCESVEDAVRRETWEESGVRVGRVIIHSTQPWPYPASLMLGCIGQALPGGETIDIGHDPELEEARWFDLGHIRRIIEKAEGGAKDGGGQWVGEGEEEEVRIPPPAAIAHQLIAAVARGFVGGVPKI